MPTHVITRRLCRAPACDRACRARSQAVSGFTLLEILVALSVLGLILGAVYGTYRAVTSSITDLQPRLDLDQEGRFFLQRLSRQIRCCYGGRTEQTPGPVQDQNDMSQMTSREGPSLFQGGRAVSDGSLLQFVTTSNTLDRRSRVGYLAVVSYRMDTLQHKLLTREHIYGRRSTDDEEEDWRVALADVLEADFEYFDGADWRKEWDSNTTGGPPKAVRIKLVLESKPDGASASFTSVAAIRCRAPEGRKSQVPEAMSEENDRTE
jgi:prepilin-type N-terminal cleavage/methylation domain-containing protein